MNFDQMKEIEKENGTLHSLSGAQLADCLRWACQKHNARMAAIAGYELGRRGAGESLFRGLIP